MCQLEIESDNVSSGPTRLGSAWSGPVANYNNCNHGRPGSPIKNQLSFHLIAISCNYVAKIGIVTSAPLGRSVDSADGIESSSCTGAKI